MIAKIKKAFKKYTSEMLGAITILLFTLINGLYIDKRCFVIGIAFEVVFCGVALIRAIIKRSNSISVKETEELLTNVTSEFMMNLNNPTVILDEDGVIIWYNQKFLEGKNSENFYGTNINDLLETKLNMNKLKTSLLENSENHEEFCASIDGVKYRVDPYKMSTSGNDFFITIWNDMSEINALEKEIDDKKSVFSYVCVDNGVDSTGNVQDNYRSVTAEISRVLIEWVDSLGGVIREFDRDKYIVMFEKSHLEEVTNDKYSILDKIREISGSDSDITYTVSIGTACLENATLREKEKAALIALELALQRGGDQAVLKYDEKTEVYGGKSKSVQKRTKLRSRENAQKLISYIRKSGNVIIMGHKGADHDAIGACVGMAWLAMSYSDNVKIVINKNDNNTNQIISKIAETPKYSKMFVDSVAGQDLISHDTLLIVCDVNNPEIFESKDIYSSIKNTVIIDHHRKAGELQAEPLMSYIDPSASSASELISEMLEQVSTPGSLDSEVAELLFSGIMLDTKSFNKNTGVRTFSAAMFLRSEGANPASAGQLFKSTIDEYKRESQFANNVINYKKVIAIALLDDVGVDSDKISSSRVADRLLSLKDIEASFVLCNINGIINISARSSGTINVQTILEKLSGGGHFDSAGAQVASSNYTEVLEKLKTAINEYLDTLTKE